MIQVSAVSAERGRAPSGDDRPIGVFDSGTGGLTVLEAMLRASRFPSDAPSPVRVPAGLPDFTGERFVYFGDQANMPYGDYPGEGRADFLRGLVANDVKFLLSHDVKIVVMACNTATAYGFDVARALLARHAGGVRLIGVVDSGAHDAVGACLAGGGDGAFSVGVLATGGTVASGVYERKLRGEFSKRGVAGGFRIFSRGCPGLADAVEAGDLWAHEIAGGYLRALLAEQRARAPEAPMRAVILGCTHFPFVRGELERIAPDVAFIDPAASTAVACHAALAADGRLAPGANSVSLEAYVSVPSPETPAAHLDAKGWFTRSYKYIRENPDDGSTRILPMRDAFAREALTFPPYLGHLPATADCLAR